MAVTIELQPENRIRPASRRLLGVNIEWVNSGDGITNNGVPKQAAYELVGQLDFSEGMLRYPGGNKADNFDWTQGEGPLGSRGQNTDIQGNTQTTYFGTGEAVGLAETALGGPKLLWQTDPHGPLSRVTQWMDAYPDQRNMMIGNEAYLQSGLEEYWIEPSDYLSIANAQIQAILSKDPSTQVGVPIHFDTIGPIPGVHYLGYNDVIIPGLDPRIRIYTIHVYMPHGSVAETAENAYYAGMAAYREVENFYADMKQQLARYGKSGYEWWMTEYGFTQQSEAARNLSVFGAMVHVDILGTMAREPLFTRACKFSLTNNAGYGIIDANTLVRRPMFWVLQMWSTMLHGDFIRTSVSGANLLSNIEYARVFAHDDTPAVSCFASSDGTSFRAIAMNKTLDASESIMVNLPEGYRITGRPRVRCLQAAAGTDVFDVTDTEEAYTYTDLAYTQADSRSVTFTAPQASILFIELEAQMPHKAISLNSNESPRTYDGGLVAITNYTAGNPPVITAPGHRFANGELIYLTGLGGLESWVSDRAYTIGSVTDDTFQLSGLNSFGSGGGGSQTNVVAAATRSAVISGATAANPVVITATNHPFTNGQRVLIQNVGGMTEINNRSFVVANAATNSFELSGEDGTGHTAYTSGGQAVNVESATISHINGGTGVFTSNGHPFSNGQMIEIRGTSIVLNRWQGVIQPDGTSMNARTYFVGGAETNTFNIDSSATFTGWGTYTSGGFAIRLADILALSKQVRVYFDSSIATADAYDAVRKAADVIAKLGVEA